MSRSLEQLLTLTATQGSWYGGGSAAALSCALAAALLEKLVHRSPDAASLRAIRRRCARLVDEDAETFAQVIEAFYQQDKARANRALKGVIRIPVAVHQAAQRILDSAARAKQTINPKYRSDLTCAVALAKASATASKAFIQTNLQWLGDPVHARRVKRQLSRRP